MRAAVRSPVAVKLNTEKFKDPSLAEMREVTVRTEKERCTLCMLLCLTRVLYIANIIVYSETSQIQLVWIIII